MSLSSQGAHFARDTVNRPGFSKLFLESASEEREHAIKVIEYLLMRGELTSDVSKLLKFPLKPIREEWNSGVEALSDALNLEAQVTRSIREIIMTCESPKDIPFNDYHVSCTRYDTFFPPLYQRLGMWEDNDVFFFRDQSDDKYRSGGLIAVSREIDCSGDFAEL